MIQFLRVPYRDDYPVREAAYGLWLKDNRIALVDTPRGLFLPGGGIEGDESQEACIIREFKEELGMTVLPLAYELSVTLTDVTPSRNFPIDMIAHCWFVQDQCVSVRPLEEDHTLVWFTLEEAARELRLVHQAWVMEHLMEGQVRPTLVAYNQHWPHWFEAIWLQLAEALQGKCKAIEHIGSTSIPGMQAKPIIDIDIVLEEGQEFSEICQRLAKLGYLHHGDQGVPGRQVMIRSGEKRHGLLDCVPHHLYVCYEGGEELKRHINFRDRLKEDKCLRDAYIAVKDEIISKVGPYNRKAYVEMKENNYQCFFDTINQSIED